jgi:hypothetical protein
LPDRGPRVVVGAMANKAANAASQYMRRYHRSMTSSPAGTLPGQTLG